MAEKRIEVVGLVAGTDAHVARNRPRVL